MIAFLGLTRSREFLSEMQRRNIGRFLVRGNVRLQDLYPGERWGFDNGAFMDWKAGGEFDEVGFLEDVGRVTESGRRPYLAVLPDLPTKGRESLEFSMAWAPRLPREWSWYLAVQDGQSEEEVKEAAAGPLVSGLFIGGSNEFKATAQKWAALAHNLGMPCHFGRASTPRKMRAAQEAGCDSFDTTQPLWDRGKFAAFLRTHDNAYESPQRELFT